MKLEKRSSGSDVTPDLPEEKGKHPVVVYIVVLFVAAFLLMAMSLVMQHRSNQAMGRLEDSVSALQETQRVQDENLQLQKEIRDLTEELAQAQSDLAESESQLAEQSQALQALPSQWFTGRKMRMILTTARLLQRLMERTAVKRCLFPGTRLFPRL